MATAGDDRDDLSVRLDWPEDPLTTPPKPHRLDVGVPTDAVGDRLDGLRERVTRQRSEGATVEDVVAQLDYAVSEMIGTLKAMNEAWRRSADDMRMAVDGSIGDLRTAIMSMLAARQADEQRATRRTADELLDRVEQALAASREQSDAAVSAVTTELQSLRRRIPVAGKGGGAGLDDASIDDLVTRVADEVEIRVAAALKPKARRKA
jgi:hypothetical protein